jgi:uncharacterized protein (TIGR00743 family)
MKPRFAAVWMLAPLWTTPIAPPHTAAYSPTARKRKQTLAALSEKARNVESEPCKINPTSPTLTAAQLDIDFVFSCEAESLIFQLGLR